MQTINHIGVSGGKDSTALLLWALHESGYDKQSLDVTFCDTGNEHEYTYKQIELLSQHSKKHGGPAVLWLHPKRKFFELAKHKKRFPSPRARFCTTELKVRPTKLHIKSITSRGIHVVMHSGVRANESHARSKLVQREDVSELITEYRPLLRWSLEQVWEMHRRYGVPINPLYAAGCARVGCLPCIMSRKSEIAIIAKMFPQVIDKIREQEGFAEATGRTFSTFFSNNKTPLRFRSVKWTGGDGTQHMLNTIDDVVKWATEKPDYKQLDLANLEMDTSAEDRTSCQSTWGSCE